MKSLKDIAAKYRFACKDKDKYTTGLALLPTILFKRKKFGRLSVWSMSFLFLTWAFSIRRIKVK